MATPATERAVDCGISELKQLLGPRASDAAAVRDHHSHGESYPRRRAPDIVCFPHTTDEVAAILTISARRQFRSSRSARARPSKGTSTPSAAASASTCAR